MGEAFGPPLSEKERLCQKGLNFKVSSGVPEKNLQSATSGTRAIDLPPLFYTKLQFSADIIIKCRKNITKYDKSLFGAVIRFVITILMEALGRTSK